MRIQSDWQLELPSNNGCFWVHYKDSDNNIHSKIRTKSNIGGSPAITFEEDGGFQVLSYDEVEKSWIEIAAPDKKRSFRFQSPILSFNSIHDGKAVSGAMLW
jgi:hypothetical protein